MRNTNQSCGAEAASPGVVPLDSGTNSVLSVLPALVAVSSLVILVAFSGFPYSKCLFCHLPPMGEIRVLFYSSSHKGLISTMFRCLQEGNPFLHRMHTN